MTGAIERTDEVLDLGAGRDASMRPHGGRVSGVGIDGVPWRNATHDWSGVVDAGHLRDVRRCPAAFAPGGTEHLVLEVLADAADEAEYTASGQCVVTLHTDGSLSVSDNGRGTETRRDDRGRMIKKPVMATKDLRFFDSPDTELLPDGHPRRGMSIVTALSDWLVHTNRRRDGAWAQRCERDLPVTDLVAIDDGGSSGTTVHFLSGEAMRGQATVLSAALRQVTAWPHLSVEVIDERDH